MPPHVILASSRVSEAATELTAMAELFTKPPSTKLVARVHKNTPALRSLIALLMAANNTSYLGLQQAQHVALVATIAQEAHRHQLAPLLARLALWLQRDAALESWGSSGHTDFAVDWSNATAGLGMLLLALRNHLEPARDLDACECLAQQVGLEEGWLAALPQTMRALSRLSALSKTAEERKTAADTVYVVCGALRVLTALVHDGPQQALVPTWRRLLNESDTLPTLCSLVASSAEQATRRRTAAGRTGALDLQLERNIHNATRELCDAVLMLDSVNVEYRQMLDHPAVEKILQMELASALATIPDKARASNVPKFHLLCGHLPLREARKLQVDEPSLVQHMELMIAVAKGHDTGTERDTALTFLEGVMLLKVRSQRVAQWENLRMLVWKMHEDKERQEFAKAAARALVIRFHETMAAAVSAADVASSGNVLCEALVEVHNCLRVFVALLCPVVMALSAAAEQIYWDDPYAGIQLVCPAQDGNSDDVMLAFSSDAAQQLLQDLGTLLRWDHVAQAVTRHALYVVCSFLARPVLLQRAHVQPSLRNTLAGVIVTAGKRMLQELALASQEIELELKYQYTFMSLKAAAHVALAIQWMCCSTARMYAQNRGEFATAAWLSGTAECSGEFSNPTFISASASGSGGHGHSTSAPDELFADAELQVALLALCRLGGAVEKVASSECVQRIVSLHECFWRLLMQLRHSQAAAAELCCWPTPMRSAVALELESHLLVPMLHNDAGDSPLTDEDVMLERAQATERARTLFMQLRDVQMYQGSCCHNPDCTNLDGPSEAQLKTFLCAGCQTCRFCSQACLKAAWKGPHKAWCKQKQQQQREQQEQPQQHRKQQEQPQQQRTQQEQPQQERKQQKQQQQRKQQEQPPQEL